MDCVIPSHSVRPFCAAIGMLSRIGKELYVEFDPLEGLTFRSLNDAKSAFCSFQWEPSFFERCTAPPPPLRKRSLVSQGEEDEHYTCRVPLKALTAVVKPRKGVTSLRIRNETSNQHSYLSFEFRMELNNKSSQRHDTSIANLRVEHRIGVAADTDGVNAVAPKDDASEVVAAPKVLLRMLDPLKGTSEVALIVNYAHKAVTATGFHHGDTTVSSYSDNAVLQASSAALLKTETSIGSDEFYEFDFVDNRPIEELEVSEGSSIPSNVNECVTLVFGMRELKAMLQFCSQSHLDQELRVSISFQWGGKPVIVDTEGDSFSAQLIMATLDHKLLGGMSSPRNAAGEE